MSLEKFSWRNSSKDIIQEIEQLPEGFFQSITRATQSHKIFEDYAQKLQISPPRNNRYQDANETREDVKRAIGTHLRSFLDTLKGDILTEFKSMLAQKQNDDEIRLKEMLSFQKESIENRTRVKQIQQTIEDLTKKIAVLSRDYGNVAWDGRNKEDCDIIKSYVIEDLKSDVLKELHQHLRKEERNISVGLQRLKVQFETELKNRFDRLNQRLKVIEDNMQEMQIGKFKVLEGVKQELSMQITNTRNQFLEDNLSLKQQFDNCLLKEKLRHPFRLHNTPEKNKQVILADNIKQAEKRIAEANHSIASVSLRMSEQLNALETVASGQVSLLHNEIVGLKDVIALAKKSDATERPLASKDMNNLVESVDFLNHITSSCQEQMLALQEQIDTARREKTLSVNNESYLKQLEGRVEELKNTLSALDVKQDPQIIISADGSRTAKSFLAAQPSPFSNTVSGLRKHGSSGDLSKWIDNMPRSRRVGSYNFLKGDSPRKQDPLEPINLYLTHFKSNLENLAPKAPIKSDTVRAVKSDMVRAVTPAILRKSGSRHYYGGPKVKTLLDGHMRRRIDSTHRSHTSNRESRDFGNTSFQNSESVENLKMSNNPSELVQEPINPRLELNHFDSFGLTNVSGEETPTVPEEFLKYSTNLFSSVPSFPFDKQNSMGQLGGFSKVQEEQYSKLLTQNLDLGPPARASAMTDCTVPTFCEDVGKDTRITQKNLKSISKNNVSSSSFSDQPDQFQDALSHVSEGGDLFHSFLQEKIDNNLLNDSFKSLIQDPNAHEEEKASAIENTIQNPSVLSTIILSPRALEVKDNKPNSEPSKPIQDKSSKKKNRSKQQRFELIISQINFFLHGKISTLVDEDEEVCCNVDDKGFIFDEYGDYVTDKLGNRIRLKPEEITKFKNEGMIE